MIRSLFTLALGAAILGTFVLPASADPAAELASCAMCHDLSPAKKPMVGPALFGLYGQKPTITGTGFTKWDKASLDKWLASPSSVKPGTSMAFMVKNGVKRAKMIEAMAELK